MVCRQAKLRDLLLGTARVDSTVCEVFALLRYTPSEGSSVVEVEVSTEGFHFGSSLEPLFEEEERKGAKVLIWKLKGVPQRCGSRSRWSSRKVVAFQNEVGQLAAWL